MEKSRGSDQGKVGEEGPWSANPRVQADPLLYGLVLTRLNTQSGGDAPLRSRKADETKGHESLCVAETLGIKVEWARP